MFNNCLIVALTAVAFNSYCTRSIPANDRTITPLPPEVQKSFDLLNDCSDRKLTKDKTKKICLELSNTEGYNLTPEDLDYFRSLLEEIMHEGKRYKRHIPQRRNSRRRRLKVRKEVRRMSRTEWRNFVLAMQSLKRKGIYDKIAAIHRGFMRLNKAHFGAAFLGWHRIYLLVLEHALHKEVHGVTIPYWDSSLDYDMKDPRKSIVWTAKFFGNGNGTVSTGPFAWRTGQGENLMRNTGAAGTLISKEAITQVLSKRRHSEIMDENNTEYWLEGHHNGPHVWVDGQFSLLDSAAEDPVFWLHHCFIDYWWQRFMNQQIHRYRINPYNDYPDVQGDHSANSRMDPFNITNRAGYHQYWINNFYTYQRSPTCNRYRPHCGSQYLRCNLTLQRCVSIKGQISTENWDGHNTLSIQNIFASPGSGRGFISAKPMLRAGRRFTSPFTDSRTTGRQMQQMRMPSAINANPMSRTSGRSSTPSRARISGGIFRNNPRIAPSRNIRRNIRFQTSRNNPVTRTQSSDTNIIDFNFPIRRGGNF